MLAEPGVEKTPLTALAAFGENLYAKLEFVHPTRSGKYRALAPHLYSLAYSGELDGIEKIVIRSAGSAAVTTAWVCRRLGIPVEAVFPTHLEEDIAGILTRLGAAVTRLDPGHATRYMLEMGGGAATYVLDQFRDSRIVAYYRSLASEILAEKPRVSAIVVGIGTGASIMGVAQEVRARQSACRVIGVWPKEFDPTWSKPYQPHGISGLAPPVRETHLVSSWIDEIVMVPSAAAHERKREIFYRAGLPVGTSSGATLDAALRLQGAGAREQIACIFASTFDCHLPEGL